MKKIDIQTIRKAARVLRVIGHPDRLRIVEALEKSSRSVKELMKDLNLSQVSVSKHLAALKKNRIVQSEAVSNFRHYSITYRNAIHILNCLRSHGGNTR